MLNASLPNPLAHHHGGPEKVVCVYPLEHYPYWEERLDRSLEPAAFGESFSTKGLLESSVHIGGPGSRASS